MSDKNNSGLSFIVGEEKRLAEIIGPSEIMPLLQSAIESGLQRAAVLDEECLPVCAVGDDSPLGSTSEIRHPLLVEGEPLGLLIVAGDPANPLTTKLAQLLADALRLTLTNNLKRMLTTEIHTAVVQESYDRLMESNRRLTESESRYRNLTKTLEIKVAERTDELQKAYGHMLQQEKMASIGQLAAGMAHEINNPTGFILSNLSTFRKYTGRMREMLELFRLLASKETSLENLFTQTEGRWHELKLDFIMKDVEALLAQSIDGAERIKRIVSDLKSFSHLDESASCESDLNSELERTLAVLAPHFPDNTVVIKKLTPLPRFTCTPGLLCQAFLSILQNSLQSRASGLELALSTRFEAQTIIITIADNGCGIPPEQLVRVFDPFFTTRDVGSGTGMGLTVAQKIVVSCNGKIEIESELKKGTTVTIRLPLAAA